MPSFCLACAAQAVAPCSQTRQIGADGQLVANRFEVVHRVERRHLVHRNRRHAGVVGDLLHYVRRQPALLGLGNSERGMTADWR